MVQRFMRDGSARVGICAHIVNSWLACPQDPRIEAVLQSMLDLSAESPARLTLIDDAVGGTLIHQLVTVSPSSRAGDSCAQVVARYLSLHPASAALTHGLTEALRTMPDPATVHAAISNLVKENPSLIGTKLIPALIAHRVQDLRNGAEHRACRLALSARCLGDVKALTPFLRQSPYQHVCTHAFCL